MVAENIRNKQIYTYILRSRRFLSSLNYVEITQSSHLGRVFHQQRLVYNLGYFIKKNHRGILATTKNYYIVLAKEEGINGTSEE